MELFANVLNNTNDSFIDLLCRLLGILRVKLPQNVKGEVRFAGHQSARRRTDARGQTKAGLRAIKSLFCLCCALTEPTPKAEVAARTGLSAANCLGSIMRALEADGHA